MSNEVQSKPAIGPIEGTTFLALTCFAGLVFLPAALVLLSRPLTAGTVWIWTALVLAEELVRFMVVTTGRRIGASWPQILFAIWLPFTIMEWGTALRSGDADIIGSLPLAGLYLVLGGVGHIALTLYYARLRPQFALIAALLTHLGWNTAILMSFAETRALILS